jgi:predicted AAA+ superfamily ATPase
LGWTLLDWQIFQSLIICIIKTNNLDSMAQRIVVFIVGPQRSGKTTVANYLADLTESLSSTDYHPTQGVRYPDNFFSRQM